MSANDIQHGGEHYKKAQFQPWDWDRYGVGSLECNVIKYVTRYRDKNGSEDLKKAHHYVLKLMEEYIYHERKNRCRYEPNSTRLEALRLQYRDQWQLDTAQTIVLGCMLTWISCIQLKAAASNIMGMLDAYTASNVQPAERVPSSKVF